MGMKLVIEFTEDYTPSIKELDDLTISLNKVLKQYPFIRSFDLEEVNYPHQN